MNFKYYMPYQEQKEHNNKHVFVQKENKGKNVKFTLENIKINRHVKFNTTVLKVMIMQELWILFCTLLGESKLIS